MRAIAIMALIATLGLAACAPAGTTDPSMPRSLAPTGPGVSQSAIVLRVAPAGGPGCDAIGIEPTPHSLTFRIDPAAADHVTARTDTGVTFTTYWTAGFQSGTEWERVIRDPTGAVVVTDGDEVPIPEGGSLRLHGYLVIGCNGSKALYVYLTDPVE